jgi:hypothetical protein
MVHAADPDRRSTKKRRGSKTRAAVRQEPDDPRWPRRGAIAVGRRGLLASGGGLAAAFAGLEELRNAATVPVRRRIGAREVPENGLGGSSLPDVQFDIWRHIAPAETAGGIAAAFPPVYTLFAPARLSSTPSRADQRQLSEALARVEDAYAFAPRGAFTFISYGVPYFSRFPCWMSSALVPRLTSDDSRLALEEAVPG